MPTPTVGNTYLFKIEAYNDVGSVMSGSAGFVLANVPSTPTVTPYSNTAVTNTQEIQILITAIAVTGDGGAPITSYSLEVDNGMGGNFVPVYGVYTNSLSLTYTFT